MYRKKQVKRPLSYGERMRIKHFNRVMPIRTLLKELGVVRGLETSVYCCFHMDEAGGHRSGLILDGPNVLLCYSESKKYTPYDCLQLLGKSIDDYDLPPLEQKSMDMTGLKKFEQHVVSFVRGKITIHDLAQRAREIHDGNIE